MFRRLTNNILVTTFRQVREVLSPAERRGLYRQVGFTIAGGFLEVFGLAMLVPLMVVAQRPELIHRNSVLSWLYETLGFGSDNAFLLFMACGVLFIFLLKNAISLYLIHRQARFAFDVSLSLSAREYWKYLDRGYLYLREKGHLSVIYYIFNIPGYFAWGIVLPFIMLFSEIFVLLLIVVSIAVYNPVLLLALFAVLIPAALLTYNGTKHKLYELGKERESVYKSSYDTLSRAIIGYPDLKLSGKEEPFLKIYLEGYSRLNNIQRLQNFLGNIPTRSMEVFAVLGIVIIFVYSILIAGRPGQLFEFIGVFAAAAFRLMPSMNRLLVSLMSIRSHLYTLDSIRDDGPHPEDGRAKVVPVKFTESIEFREVRFRYAGKEKHALEGVSFKVNKGEKIGIIGESGSGKTTLMNLLLRFVEEDSGDILIDGKKMTQEETRGLRRLMGYVQQEVFVMNDTLRRNIAYGEADKNIDEAALQRAIDQASLRKFVDELPEGANTMIGEMGSNLSGGQKQRLGIARALYRNSQILVFDEATSALDMETEREVTEAIDNLSGRDKTIFIIAHRITTLRGCDRIIELKDGKIAGTWKYEDLLREKIR